MALEITNNNKAGNKAGNHGARKDSKDAGKLFY
jgi:hypothetical protein